MTKYSFKDVDWARRTLGLSEEATFAQVNEAYKKEAFLNHPDKCPPDKKEACEEHFKNICRARDILIDFCMHYTLSFREEDVRRSSKQDFYEDHMKRFYDDWWGKVDRDT